MRGVALSTTTGSTRGRKWKPTKKASQSSKASSGGIIREGIFGINDGLVATVGLVSGESLSGQSHGAILIAALSAVGAAIVSMSVGSYLATSSQNDFMRHQIRQQELDLDRHPGRERGEAGGLLEEIGVPKASVRPVLENIVRSRPRWLKFMVREDLGIHEQHIEPPIKNALTMGIAVTIGSIPAVVPYLLPIGPIMARNLSWGVSVLTALSLGGLKGHFTRSSIAKNALAFAFLASASAAVGAGIGLWLAQLGA